MRQSINGILKCSDVKTIDQINDQYKYKDEKPRGSGDGPLVACGQDEKSGYNEIDYIFKNILQKHIDNKETTEEKAIDALCLACANLKNPRRRTDFYAYLEKELDIKIK